MTILAQYFDGKTSDKKEVAIKFLENYIVQVEGEGVNFQTSLDDITFSSRIGNIPRILTFTNGSEAHCDENDKIDLVLKQLKNSSSLAHIFESKMRYVVISVIFLFLSVGFFLTLGSSMAAYAIAQVIPQSIENKISHSTLKTLDEYLLEPSTLSQEKKDEFNKLFTKLNNNELKYNLHFRKGIGANAFALPSGDIILTDELIELSDGDNDMIYGVLAHERGHVEYKHSMQLLVKASIVSAVITYFTGDVSSLAATLSASAINATYSRDFERESDEYAKMMMKQEGISPKHLADFFIKMSEDRSDSNETKSYFDSHPPSKERIDYLLAP